MVDFCLFHIFKDMEKNRENRENYQVWITGFSLELLVKNTLLEKEIKNINYYFAYPSSFALLKHSWASVFFPSAWSASPLSFHTGA